MPVSNIQYPGGIIMNTRISKKFVFTFSILLAAIWLPLTTLANNMLATTPVSDSSIEESSFGFSETDPSEQLFADAVTVVQAQQLLASAGFSETDPANSRARDNWIVIQISRNQVQQNQVGFDETDPSTDADQLYCLDVNVEKQPVQITRVFSSSDIPGQ